MVKEERDCYLFLWLKFVLSCIIGVISRNSSVIVGVRVLHWLHSPYLASKQATNLCI